MEHNVIGLDIGGTKIFAARYSLDLTIQEEIRVPTQADKGRDQVLRNMIHAIRKIKNEKTHAVGIGWAGFVNAKTGFIYKAPNIPGFQDFALGDFLRKEFHIPFKIENDARVFALAEQKINSPEVEDFLGIILGTGVGSGLILNGEIVDGHSNFAGEVGHMFVRFETKTEAEDVFSGPALSKLFQEKIGESSMRMVENLMDTRKQEIDSIMEPVLEKMAFWIYNLCLAYNPGKIVFGGGIGSFFLPHFEKMLVHKIQNYIDESGYPISFEIGFSQMKNSGSVGAALIAWNETNK